MQQPQNTLLTAAHSNPIPTNTNSLSAWMQLYYLLKAKTLAPETQKAKLRDLNKFLFFYRQYTHTDQLHYWIAPLTKAFQNTLLTQISHTTGHPYKATTINRALKTIKHFANWLTTRQALTDGNPAKDIKYITEDEPDWKGLTQEEIQALAKACQHRLTHCTNAHQNPKLETALFYCLLHTGLRESELININITQYADNGFHRVIRKNNRITTLVPVPTIANQFLKNYLATRPHTNNQEPLFLSRFGNRLSSRDVRRICERLAKQANTTLKTQNFHFSPHQLRHTFLKRVTDKHGLHFAHRMSGNISVREIFRYTKPSQSEIEECAETLFD